MNRVAPATRAEANVDAAEAEQRRVCSAIALATRNSEALIAEGFECVLEAVERFSKKYPWQEEPAFCLGMDTLIKCASRYDPERGPFSHYLRATLRWEFKSLKRGVKNFSALSRYDEDGKEIAFDPKEDISALEFADYTEEERKVALAVYARLVSDDPELAQIFRWSSVDGVSLKEIGRRIGCSHETARRRKQGARRRIKQLLESASKLDGMGGRRRQARQRDWGQTMVDPQVIRYEEDVPKRFPPGWTRHLPGDQWEKRRK